ncbi:MAG: hypothetical protein Q7K39_03885 [Candidatus Magasanikbacteria bacterium]|nr:hypothetical protein [Candidatus Magasanikbacteria bacterium]
MAGDRGESQKVSRKEVIITLTRLFTDLAAAPAESDFEDVVPHVRVFDDTPKTMKKFGITFADFGLTQERFSAGHRAANCFEMREWLKLHKTGAYDVGAGGETHAAQVIARWKFTAAELGITEAEFRSLLGANN